MRELTGHKVGELNGAVEVIVLDGPDTKSSANHEYKLDCGWRARRLESLHIHFQHGVLSEVGVNGFTNESLLVVLIDRMEGFQRGQFACAENQEALEHLRLALTVLNGRTLNRIKRGVEGQHKE